MVVLDDDLDIFVANRDGGGLTPIASDPDLFEFAISFTPDGESITFVWCRLFPVVGLGLLPSARLPPGGPCRPAWGALMKTERYRHSARQRKKIETPFGDLLAATNLMNRYQISLWAKAAMASGPSGGFSGHVREDIERNTKEFIVDWTLDQQ